MFGCRYSASILQHWVGGRGLIYFCKVDHSRIFINFSRNWLGLNNLCEILLAYLESKVSSRACQTCNMIMHIQSPGIVGTVYSSTAKDIKPYSGILRYIQSHSQARRGRGEAFPARFENRKQSSGFKKKGSDCVHLWVKFSSNSLQPGVAYLYSLKISET